MIVQFAKNLYTLHSKRASVVPYTFIADDTGKFELWVLLGVHASSGEITDLGGGVKRSESDIEAAYREFMEESNGVFSQEVKSVTDLEKCVSISRLRDEKVIGPLKTKVYVEGVTSIFLPLNSPYMYTIISDFDKVKKDDDEIRSLMWVRGKDILQPTSKKYKMWSFIRKFYYEALTPELLDMLFVSWINMTRR
jgi:8-oxo-dGTP pyrophosphatase MutT (NUDIX family)